MWILWQIIFCSRKSEPTQENCECDSCEKVFSHAHNLKAHEKAVHQRQKDFKCGQCEKAFATSSNLKIHIRAVHAKEKAFHCEQ